MLNPDTAFSVSADDIPPERFGIRDVEDATWKNYSSPCHALSVDDASVCPANITGKKLSPRKIMMDMRARMKEKDLLWLKTAGIIPITDL